MPALAAAASAVTAAVRALPRVPWVILTTVGLVWSGWVASVAVDGFVSPSVNPMLGPGFATLHLLGGVAHGA